MSILDDFRDNPHYKKYGLLAVGALMIVVLANLFESAETSVEKKDKRRGGGDKIKTEILIGRDTENFTVDRLLANQRNIRKSFKEELDGKDKQIKDLQLSLQSIHANSNKQKSELKSMKDDIKFLVLSQASSLNEIRENFKSITPSGKISSTDSGLTVKDREEKAGRPGFRKSTSDSSLTSYWNDSSDKSVGRSIGNKDKRRSRNSNLPDGVAVGGKIRDIRVLVKKKAGKSKEQIANEKEKLAEKKLKRAEEKLKRENDKRAKQQRLSQIEEDRKKIYIPPGSIISGVLLSGIDAPTSNTGKENPHPIVVRIKHDAILPNRFRFDLKECLILASGYGSLSAERAYIRAEKLSCVRKDGGIIDVAFDASAVGSDGKAGLRGVIVSKNKQTIINTLKAGFLSGFAKGLSPKTILGDSGTTDVFVTPNTGDAVQSGLFQGAANALDRIAEYYISVLENIFPVVEILPGRKVDFILVNGVDLNLKGDVL